MPLPLHTHTIDIDGLATGYSISLTGLLGIVLAQVQLDSIFEVVTYTALSSSVAFGVQLGLRRVRAWYLSRQKPQK